MRRAAFIAILVAPPLLAGCAFDLSVIAVRPADAGVLDASADGDMARPDLSGSDLGPEPTDLGPDPADLGPELTDMAPAEMPCDLPWGGTIDSGTDVTAYSASAVSCGDTCVSETRTCTDGVLSGSYDSASCSVALCASCDLPWGATVGSGTSTTAYSASSVACGGTCASETRTCTDGVLSGTYGNVACTVGDCADCTVAGLGTITHGGSTTAYSAPSVACGSTCSSETRVCDNGTLSGTYANAACSVTACADCTVAGLGTIAHESTTIAYSTASVACGATCTSQTRTCTNGVLSGAFPNAACTVGSCACDLPWGGSIANGGSTTAYQASSVTCGNVCVSQARTCTNGVLSGSYTNAACSVAACSACSLPWGGTIASGTSATAYSTASVACGSVCLSEARSCTSGVLSGSYTNAACTVGSCACASPWGGTSIPNGTSVTAYQSPSVACGGSCGTVSQVRTCTSGVLSGTYTNAACSVAACAPCTVPGGGSIASGASMTAYSTSSVACGSTCASQTRTCNNGALSGSYANASCSVGACASCTVAGLGTIAHGSSTTAFSASSVACGALCSSISETRICNNGVLSGSFTNASCAPLPCPCTVTWAGGVAGTIPSGGSAIAYASNSVACGALCSSISETRICTNGTLSGSYLNQTCAPTPCPCSLPWGGTIPHSTSVTAYSASSVACGMACSSVQQVRSCNNGVLSGSGNFGSCTVSPCTSCALPWGGTIATGTSVMAYASASTCGLVYCNPIMRTCNNGTLSGTGNYQTCAHANCCAACCVTNEPCSGAADCCSGHFCDSSDDSCQPD